MEFKCSFCEKVCRNKQNLQDHIKTHTGEKPFACQFCGKTFPNKGNLALHEPTHYNTKQEFKCSVCDTVFKLSCQLEKHKIIHTGERPFACKHCGKAFAYKGNMISVDLKDVVSGVEWV